MKATKKLLAAFAAVALLAPAHAQDADTNKTAAPNTADVSTNAAPIEIRPRTATTLGDSDKGLRLNFRGAPLEQVLNYMSDAAGFIINIAPGTDVKGKVDVWSNTPLTKDEAAALLNTVLGDHDLASIRTGRTLTIVNRNDAKTRRVPVEKGADPKDIPVSDEMVTQIIPVKYANAAALIQNLQPLLPEYAQNGMSANESGNSLLLTATKADVKRVAEIVSALDTAIASVSEIKVYPLKYADAKELVAAIKELFTPPAQQNQGNNNNQRGQFLQQMFGPGGGGGPFGGGNPFGGGGPGGGNNGGRGGNGGNNAGARGNTSATAARVVAVADERSNSLIVATAADALPEIDRLIKEIDVEVDDVMEIRLFTLVNADPVEISEQLATLFPDPTSTSSNNNNNNGFGGARFGGFGGGGGGGNRGGQASNTSERAKKQGRVLSVPDQRTSSIIVTASHEMMPQIEGLIKGLDMRRAKRQIVRVYQVENGDVDAIQQVLRDTFDRSNNSRATTTQGALQTRSQQNAQNQGQTSQTSGSNRGSTLGNAFSQ